MKPNNNTVHFYPLLAIVVGLLGCPPPGPGPVVDTGDTGAAISEDDDEDGFTVADGDCDDSNPSVYPGAEELCDGLDSDCDGLLPVDDPDTDLDFDGFSACAGDCDDLNGMIHPAAVEIPGDGIDQNCDGEDAIGTSPGEDEDEDGFTVADGDCDDSNPSVYPGAEELCDGLDSDCDGLLPVDDPETDVDGDGFSACTDDCDDLDPATYPDAVDIPGDGIDQDCNGEDAVD